MFNNLPFYLIIQAFSLWKQEIMYVDAYAVVVSFEKSSDAILSELVFSTFSLN